MKKESQARTILFLDLVILLLQVILTVILIFNPSLVEDFIWKLFEADESMHEEMKSELAKERIPDVVEAMARIGLVFTVLAAIGYAILCSLLYVGIEKRKSRKLTYWVMAFTVIVVLQIIGIVYKARKPQKAFGIIVYGIWGCSIVYRLVALIVIWCYRKELIEAAYTADPAAVAAAYEVQYSLT